MTEKYEDIINLPHHVSKTRPQMSMLDRAAQFSPFAALSGYDDAVKEAGRLTDNRVELEDEGQDLLDRKLQYLQEIIADRPEISVTFFIPDEKKPGGSYAILIGNLKRVDLYERLLVMTDGKKIPLDDIADIKGDCFQGVL